jgi:hypothetical protein
MLNFSLQKKSPSELKITGDLLNQVFQRRHFSPEFLRWQYYDNPAGEAIAFNAYDDNLLVGHYAAQPAISKIEGFERRGLVLVNAGISNKYQGKGVWGKLNKLVTEEAEKQSYTFMVATPNKNSMPIFTGKFGFRPLGTLDVKIGFGKPTRNNSSAITYEMCWPLELLRWRLNCPKSKYTFLNYNDSVTAFCKTKYKFLSIQIGSFESKTFPIERLPELKKSGLVMWIGIDPNIDWEKSTTYMNFPEVLKPAPLNLVFKELNAAHYNVDRDHLLYRAIDFDGF